MHKTKYKSLQTCSGILIWLLLIALCLINKDKISIDGILSYSPENPALASLLLLTLFVLKGITMVINGNILYMACGLMFPMHWALTVNITGTLAMTTIAYVAGKKGGSGLLESLIHKYPKLEIIKSFPRNNEFSFTLLLRLFGILPCEPVGLYLGACGISFPSYLAGTMLGLSPAILAYALMGKYLYAPSSVPFIGALILQFGSTACVTLYLLIRKTVNPS